MAHVPVEGKEEVLHYQPGDREKIVKLAFELDMARTQVHLLGGRE